MTFQFERPDLALEVIDFSLEHEFGFDGFRLEPAVETLLPPLEILDVMLHRTYKLFVVLYLLIQRLDVLALHDPRHTHTLLLPLSQFHRQPPLDHLEGFQDALVLGLQFCDLQFGVIGGFANPLGLVVDDVGGWKLPYFILCCLLHFIK